MRTYTTPLLNITLKRKDGTVVTDLMFDYLIFTVSSGKKRIDKRIEASEVEEGTFSVRFTQEETGSLGAYGTTKAEINFFSGNYRLATVIKNINMDANLIEEVI